MISAMVTKTPRNVTIQAIAVTVMAAALTVSCAAKSSTVAGQPIPATTTSASVSSANTAAADAKSGAPTAEQALAQWIGAVVSGDFDQACSVMADAEQTPPKVFSPETCAGQDETMKSVRKVLDGLRTAFTPDNAANPPKVEVAGPAATGDSAKIAADKISVEEDPRRHRPVPFHRRATGPDEHHLQPAETRGSLVRHELRPEDLIQALAARLPG